VTVTSAESGGLCPYKPSFLERSFSETLIQPVASLCVRTGPKRACSPGFLEEFLGSTDSEQGNFSVRLLGDANTHPVNGWRYRL